MIEIRIRNKEWGIFHYYVSLLAALGSIYEITWGLCARTAVAANSWPRHTLDVCYTFEFWKEFARPGRDKFDFLCVAPVIYATLRGKSRLLKTSLVLVDSCKNWYICIYVTCTYVHIVFFSIYDICLVYCIHCPHFLLIIIGNFIQICRTCTRYVNHKLNVVRSILALIK